MTQQYAKKFWEMLIKNAAVGAILALHFALAFKIIVIFDDIGIRLTELTDDPDMANPYSGGQMPGFADVSWGDLLKVIFTFVLVRAAVKAAKSTSFAEGFISSTEGAINGFGKRMARKPYEKAKQICTGSLKMTGQGLGRIPMIPI